MPKQGLMYAAITAASIATGLATKADQASAYEHWSVSGTFQPLHLVGEIQQIRYENLHTTLQVKVGDRLWAIILPPLSQLQQYALSSQVFSVGQPISLFGHSHDRDVSELWAEQIVVGDRTITLG